jgi:hypothetical protein
MVSQHAENTVAIEQTPSSILSALLNAADSVLTKARTRTLRPYGADMEPRYEPAIIPADIRMCA